MFAAKYLSSRPSLLSDLCELGVKKIRHARPNESVRLIAQLLPSFYTAAKCATRTNARKLNRLIGLLHNFRIPGGGGISRAESTGCISRIEFRFSAHLTTANAKSLVQTWGEPSPHHSAAIPKGWPSTRNTTSPAGPRHQSASTADCASIPQPAESSSPGLAAKTSSQRFGKSKPAKANSKPPQNQSGTDHVAPASRSPGWKTTASPLRISSVRIFGSTKSMVVVTGSPVYFCSIRYGALFELGVCGLIRNPFGIGSNFFSFS